MQYSGCLNRDILGNEKTLLWGESMLGGGGAEKKTKRGRGEQSSVPSVGSGQGKAFDELVQQIAFKLEKYEMRAYGRPQSALGVQGQGDHVSAFSFVKSGFTWHFKQDVRGGEERSINMKKQAVVDYIVRLGNVAALTHVQDGRAVDADEDASPKKMMSTSSGSESDSEVGNGVPSASSSISYKSEQAVQERLIKRVVSLLKEYNTSRVFKTYIKMKVDKVRDKVRRKVKRLKELVKIRELLSILDYNKEKSIPVLIEYFLNRMVRGDKKSAKEQLKTKLNPISDGKFDAESVTKVVSKVHLDILSVKAEEIKQLKFSYRSSVKNLCEALSEMAMPYYNRLPDVAYNRVKTVRNNTEAKVPERTALRYLEVRYGKGIDDEVAAEKWAMSKKKEIQKALEDIKGFEVLEETSPKEYEKLEERIKRLKTTCKGHQTRYPITLVNALEGLFDYAEVKTPQSGKKGYRDNSKEGLVLAMAKHIYIFLSIYPQALEKYGAKGIDDVVFHEKVIWPFVDRVLDFHWTKDLFSKRIMYTAVFAQLAVLSIPNQLARARTAGEDSSSGNLSDGSTESASHSSS